MGEPMLSRMLERVVHAKELAHVVVATTTKPEDDALEAVARTWGAGIYRGSEDDVLDRVWRAATEAGADVVVGITGDCPLMDPQVIDEVVQRFVSRKVDYTRTPTNYPEGLDCEVVSFAALDRAAKEAVLPSHREHVLPYIWEQPDKFEVDEPWRSGVEDNSTMHWSVDTPQDFAFVSEIFETLYPTNPQFGKDDVLALLAREPALLEINKGGTGWEGYAKSKREDEEWKKHNQ